MILYSVTFGLARSNDIRAYLPGMLLCVVLMTLVCSFGMSMLLGKSLKIFRRTWKGTVLLAALLAAVCVCVRMDVADVERRVPKADEIESVTVQCRHVQSFTATSEDTETIEAIRAIHRAILEQVEDGDVRNLTAVEAQMLYQAAQQDVAQGRVISDILSDTGYSPLQVDITGNDWDCVLNLDNFTDDAHTLELVNRFLSGGDGESGE